MLDSKGCGSTATVLAGYKALLIMESMGELQNLRVVNMSLAADYDECYDETLADIISIARSQGIVTVCVGGNGNSKGEPNTSPVFPADCAEAVSVTALAKDGSNTSFSDYNAYKDISAPGEGLLTTARSGSYALVTGTSSAAPVASGILGLLWLKYPDLSVDRALEAVYKTANFVNPASSQHVTKDKRGISSGSHGAVDANRAFSCLAGEVKSIAGCAVSKISVQVWTGAKVTPKVKVSYKGAALVEGRDYSLVSLGSTKVGSGVAVLAVVGKGSYCGWLSKAFTVEYNLSRAKVRRVKSGKATSVVLRGLERKAVYRVKVRSYKKTGAGRVYSAWSKTIFAKTI